MGPECAGEVWPFYPGPRATHSGGEPSHEPNSEFSILATMRIIGPLDRKPFFGVAIAVTAGLMLGGAMKPDLNEEALNRAPQLQQPRSGERVQFIDTRASTASYRHGQPDWVVGTDFLKAAYAEPAPEREAAIEETYEVAAWQPPETPTMPAEGKAPTSDEVETAERVFPSLSGDILGATRSGEHPTDDRAETAEPLAD